MILAGVVLCLLIFTACREKNVNDNYDIYSHTRYRIELSDYKDIVRKYPKSAKSGDSVTVLTNRFMDVSPKIYVNGEDIGNWSNGMTEYTFVMPEENVVITTKLQSSGNW